MFAPGLNVAHVSAHGFALAEGGVGSDQCGQVNREGRHGAAYRLERVFGRDDSAQTEGGQAGSLGKSARDEKIWVAANPGQGREAGKFGIGFVENYDGVASGGKNLAQGDRRNERASRIVGVGQEKKTRLFSQRGE